MLIFESNKKQTDRINININKFKTIKGKEIVQTDIS